ncbi:MAG: SH3 domain-containing protein [Lachnospiraceae bacterium]|nr:SH3 domain-containing protein [Lachnospiraceae bacterium]
MKKLKLFAAVIVSILTLTAPASVLATENTSTEQSASGYEVKDTSLTCYVNSEKGLNVRSGPSTDYSVIGTLSNGSKIEVTGESGGWYRFDYNGKDGFVATKYTTTQATDSNGSSAAASDDNTTSSTDAADENSESKLAIFDDSTLVYLSLAIVVVVMLILVSVRGFFKKSPSEYEEDYEDEYPEEDEGNYSGEDEYSEEDFENEEEYVDENDDMYREEDYDDDDL